MTCATALGAYAKVQIKQYNDEGPIGAFKKGWGVTPAQMGVLNKFTFPLCDFIFSIKFSGKKSLLMF